MKSFLTKKSLLILASVAVIGILGWRAFGRKGPASEDGAAQAA